MKFLLTSFLFFGIRSSTESQVIYSDPIQPTWEEEMTLYIDVNLSIGDEISALKEMLIAHPELVNEVYIWIWQPSEPASGNGPWSNSNESLLMTWVSDLTFSISFIPSAFFTTTESDFFTLGISCLAKLDNGSDYSGEFSGQAKTEDLHISTTLSIENSSSDTSSNILVYPNPASAKIYLTSSNVHPESILVYDIAGKLVLKYNSSALSNDINPAIDVSLLCEGLYLLLIKAGDSNTTQKIEIKKS